MRVAKPAFSSSSSASLARRRIGQQGSLSYLSGSSSSNSSNPSSSRVYSGCSVLTVLICALCAFVLLHTYTISSSINVSSLIDLKASIRDKLDGFTAKDSILSGFATKQHKGGGALSIYDASNNGNIDEVTRKRIDRVPLSIFEPDAIPSQLTGATTIATTTATATATATATNMNSNKGIADMKISTYDEINRIGANGATTSSSSKEDEVDDYYAPGNGFGTSLETMANILSHQTSIKISSAVFSSSSSSAGLGSKNIIAGEDSGSPNDIINRNIDIDIGEEKNDKIVDLVGEEGGGLGDGSTSTYRYKSEYPIHDMFKHINFDELVAKSLPRPKSGHLEAFASHPFHSMSAASKSTLVTYMVSLQNLDSCRGKPLFVTLAKVQGELYWQLIENFFYTMYMFNNLECTVMICISDTLCMDRCSQNKFPCFDYDPLLNSPKENNVEGVSPLTKHVMEHVAEIKLYHVGQAVQSGVNIMLLDLDVSFLKDPLLLYQGFLDNPYEHVRAQMDMGFSTNQSTGHTWYAHPRPNFGLFLIKAHPFSSKVFAQAWRSYLKIDSNNNKTWEVAKKTGIKPNHNRLVDKTHVAVDQNTIVGALKWARWRFDYNFSYFYLGFMLDIYPRPIIPFKVVLLDKMPLVNRNISSKIAVSKGGDGSGQAVYVSNSDRVFRGELGGALARALLDDVVAVHATCHEGGTKLLGLKAANAFWNNRYYNTHRRTITKPLIFLSKRQLTREIMALYYIAMKTNRSLIIPNVLIGVGLNIPGQLDGSQCRKVSLKRTFFCKERVYSGPYSSEDLSHAHKYRDEHYWPSWRTVKQVIDEVSVIEPAYYYRLQTDYQFKESEIPKPYIHTIDLSSPLYSSRSTSSSPSSSTEVESDSEAYDFHAFYDPTATDNRVIDAIVKGILEADNNGDGIDTTSDTKKDVPKAATASMADSISSGHSVLVDRDNIFDVQKIIPLSAWALDSLSDWKANDVADSVDGDTSRSISSSSSSSSSRGVFSQTFDDDYFDSDPFDPSNSNDARGKSSSDIRRRLVVAKYAYTPLPFVAQGSVPIHWLEKSEGRDPFGLCRTFLGNIPTNRSCFDKCK